MGSRPLAVGDQVSPLQGPICGRITNLSSDAFAMEGLSGQVSWFPRDLVYTADSGGVRLVCWSQNIERYALDAPSP